MSTQKGAELTQRQRATAAMGGAMISAVVVTPLDVAKTRLQISLNNRSMFGTVQQIVRNEGGCG
jgi:hypothetical protein